MPGVQFGSTQLASSCRVSLPAFVQCPRDVLSQSRAQQGQQAALSHTDRSQNKNGFKSGVCSASFPRVGNALSFSQRWGQRHFSLVVKHAVSQSPPVFPDHNNTGMCWENEATATFIPLPQRSGRSQSRAPLSHQETLGRILGQTSEPTPPKTVLSSALHLPGLAGLCHIILCLQRVTGPPASAQLL